MRAVADVPAEYVAGFLDDAVRIVGRRGVGCAGFDAPWWGRYNGCGVWIDTEEVGSVADVGEVFCAERDVVGDRDFVGFWVVDAEEDWVGKGGELEFVCR